MMRIGKQRSGYAPVLVSWVLLGLTGCSVQYTLPGPEVESRAGRTASTPPSRETVHPAAPEKTPPTAPVASPRASAVHQLLAQARTLQQAGQLRQAAGVLERAQRIDSRAPQVYLQLAEVRLALGEAGQAEQLARRALTLAHGQAELQRQAWALIERSRR